jgi:hypothetical protein
VGGEATFLESVEANLDELEDQDQDERDADPQRRKSTK